MYQIREFSGLRRSFGEAAATSTHFSPFICDFLDKVWVTGSKRQRPNSHVFDKPQSCATTKGREAIIECRRRLSA